MDTNFEVIVIGAGAAGMVAAARAAENGKSVLLLEKMERPGRKLLITGKGRCNITNSAYANDFIKQIHPDGKYLKYAFSRFFNQDILQILHENGVETNTERGGRVFPEDNNAASVVEALSKWLKHYKVNILYKASVRKLLLKDECISGVEANINGDVKNFTAKSVIICTGGKSYAATGSSGDGYALAEHVGHSIEKLRPALVPIVTSGTTASDLQGLALKNANATVWVNDRKARSDFGELLFTHFGLSGPVILTCSRTVVDALAENHKVEISIDLKPALDDPKLDARLIRDLSDNGKKNIDNIFKLWMPSKMIPIFFNKTGIDPKKEGHQISGKERKKIRLLMKDFRLTVSGTRSFKEAIITAGGVCTNEVDSKTMESKKIKGLYFAGEVLDLDANTGGYNLQIAWSTGWLAGESCTA